MAEHGDTDFETPQQREDYRERMERNPCARCDPDTREMLRALDLRDRQIAELEAELARMCYMRERR